jgi:hypothetical protein
MKNKFLLILILGISTALIIPTIAIGQIQYYNNTMFDIELYDWDTVYFDYFDVSTDDWDTGSKEGPDLWHVTSFDSWGGNNSFACFDSGFKTYVNNMYFNWALIPINIDVEDEIEIVMDFYYKFITEDIDDNWGICLYDPILDEFIPFTYSNLPYDTYGYHPEWTGPMQPMSVYQSFDILAAYDYGYSIGLFRDNNGSQAFELRIGFMFYESDNTGVTNAEAEADDVYWSGLIIDDVIIRHLVFNQAPLTPEKPLGLTLLKKDVSYEFTAITTDPDDDNIRYGWDWNGDDIIDYITGFIGSGESTTVSHIWVEEGTYNIRVKAEDENGAMSVFSGPLTVTVTTNSPPNKPIITGDVNGKVGAEYEYTISSTDPDGDAIYFEIEWFSGCPGVFWEGPYPSSEQVIKTNTWNDRGDHTITVRVKDSYDLEGESTTLLVTMPKYQNNNLALYQFFSRLIEYFPSMQISLLFYSSFLHSS